MILPNADPFEYKGNKYFTQTAKTTKGKTIEKFFGDSSGS